MANENGVVEKRAGAKVLAKINVTYREMIGKETDELIASQRYQDLTKPPSNLDGPKPIKGVVDLISETIMDGDLRLVGKKQFTDRRSMMIELILPGAPIPIRTLSVITSVLLSKNVHGMYEATVRFFAISKEDVLRVERHLARVRAMQAQK